jgi:hypothetical protein
LALGYANVDKMLAEMTSEQISEWKAYELATGPLDRGYDQRALAELHEQIQLTNYLLGAANFSDKDHENPIPEPQKYGTPDKYFRSPRSDEIASVTLDLKKQQEELAAFEPGTLEHQGRVEDIMELRKKLEQLQR